jgi:hypothetical protein
MKKSIWCILFAAIVVFGGASRAGAQTPPPALFFSDLTIGPNGGNTDTTFSASGNGAYVTLYGNNFGSSQGASTVTWNGQRCLTVVPATGGYLGWGSSHLWYQEIIVQIMSTCTPGSGNFVVTTSAGTSNGLPFTVNAIGGNHIYFASTTGSDSGGTGTFQSPFGSGPHCDGSGDTSSVERAGDICYVENGDNITGTNGFASLTPTAYAGTATAPVALGVYPGASVTIGSNTQDKGIEDCTGYTPQCNTGANQYLVLFGFHVRGQSYAVSIQGSNVRVVALEVQCPDSGNGTNLGCFNTIANFETVLGNEVSNTGMSLYPGGTCGKLCHNMYIGYTGAGQNFEIGWNSSHDANGGRLYQFFNGSAAGYNINFHDNMGYNNVGVDGVTIDGNPDAGYVNVYNNVIFNVCGNPDESGDCTCLYLQDTAGTTTNAVNVYNNTFGPGCSHNNSISYGMYAPLIRAKTTNNVFYATISGEPYIASSCSSNGCANNLTGSNNIWYGGTGAPSQTTANITAQPTFVSLAGCSKAQGPSAGDAGCNLAPLASSSPQVKAGTSSQASAYDINGLIRGNSPSIGAFEQTSGTAPVLPNPPTNLTVVVN